MHQVWAERPLVWDKRPCWHTLRQYRSAVCVKVPEHLAIVYQRGVLAERGGGPCLLRSGSPSSGTRPGPEQVAQDPELGSVVDLLVDLMQHQGCLVLL